MRIASATSIKDMGDVIREIEEMKRVMNLNAHAAYFLTAGEPMPSATDFEGMFLYEEGTGIMHWSDGTVWNLV